MKKLLLASAMVIASAASAHAAINVDIGLGGPGYVEPAYVEPAPVYYAPHPHEVDYYNGRDRHRHANHDYFRNQAAAHHDNHAAVAHHR
jgi:hypothetical protein